LLVELGSGTSRKTRLLLDHIRTPAGYVPVDISRDQLLDSAKQLENRYPGLPITPVCADYTRSFELPPAHKPATRIIVFFPGSTVGNFEPTEAEKFLGRIARIIRNGYLIIGFDLRKEPAIHEKAYNDPEGVTAAFNRNILVRANRELGTNFKPEAFEHRAVFNSEAGRIEMHLVSRGRQGVHLDGERFEFEPGESIVTEYSYKYTRDEFYQMTHRAGFQRERSWNDRRQYFEVCLLKAGTKAGIPS
jgi:dimethylhistidine N-methyltransferase